jgi:predicted Zn-dependent peptidase
MNPRIPRPMKLAGPRARRLGALLLLSGLLAPGAAAQSRVAVIPEPGTPVIATEVLLAVGPADEAAGKEGLAYLAARSVTEPLRAVMDSLGAHLAIAAHKDAISFSLTAAPDAWEEASRALLVSLFRDPADSLAVVRERRAIRAELAGRESNPADAVTREADAVFFGARHPWGRATVGTPRSIERLAFSDVSAFLREHFLPSRAVVAVVGPIDPDQGRRHLLPFVGSGDRVPVEMAPASPARLPVRRDYNSITTWVSASFSFPETADLEAIRFFAHAVTEAIAFGPAQSSVFNASSEVIPRIGGGEVRFQVVIPPQQAGEWAGRIQEAVAQIGRPMHDDVFASRYRRYRGDRLMALGTPEARANEAARQLLVTGRERSLLPDLDGLDAERLQAAARAMRSPSVVFLGPVLDDDRD